MKSVRTNADELLEQEARVLLHGQRRGVRDHGGRDAAQPAALDDRGGKGGSLLRGRNVRLRSACGE